MRFPRGLAQKRNEMDRLFKGIMPSADRIQLGEIGERNKIRADARKLALIEDAAA